MRVSRLNGSKAFMMVALLSLIVCLSGFANAAGYKMAFLTADQTGKAPNVDPKLINPWGISFSSTGDFWVSDNNSGFSTLYNTTGVPQSLIVTIPPVGGATSGTPTGTVFNGTTGFVITQGTKSSPALFLFDSEDGSISGWAPTVNATSAVTAVDNSGSGSIYKSMELALNGSSTFLYVCNFFAAKVEVYDSTFHQVSLSGSFTDPHLPSGFAPHNIRNIGGKLYVTYAKQNATKSDVVPGPGLGFVDTFDLNGNFIKRFASKGKLNAPWGLAQATASFGTFSNDILVANLGDGRVTAYDPTTGAVKGQLSTPTGTVISISGLWALMFGNGGQGGALNVLYFTAGPNAYAHGRFGSITAQ
jgi:uncharacterized protein (TIGR03118 family)